MKAADIMTTKVVTVAADATIEEAAALMLRHHVSALPVVDQAGKLVGIVSEGDLMRRGEFGTQRERSWWLSLLTPNSMLAADYAKSHGHKISEVMSRKVIAARPDTLIGDIALLLEQHAIKRVPIIDQDKLVGIVARANLVQALAGLQIKTTEAQGRKDSQIRKEILRRLSGAPWRPWLLNVTVHDSVAELWGIANSDDEKTAAGVAAENVPGVAKVSNHIVVRAHNWDEAKAYFAEDAE